MLVNHRESIQAERRGVRRYSVDIAVKYSVMDGSRVLQTGVGITANISDTGILFISETKLQPGVEIRLALRWPAVDSEEAVEFRASGWTVRSESEHCAVRIRGGQFHHEDLRI